MSKILRGVIDDLLVDIIKKVSDAYQILYQSEDELRKVLEMNEGSEEILKLHAETDRFTNDDLQNQEANIIKMLKRIRRFKQKELASHND